MRQFSRLAAKCNCILMCKPKVTDNAVTVRQCVCLHFQCFMAFNCVNLFVLFQKLFNQKTCPSFLGLLIHIYYNNQMRVK